MDDFGMGYALGQDSGSSCRDGGSGMWAVMAPGFLHF